jgi:hypothetical protein
MKWLMVAIVVMALALPAAASAANCDTAPAWTGTGPTTTVSAGQSIQTAVNNTSAGGTVIVANGSYSSFSLTKNVRVMAQTRYGATVSSGPTQTAGWIDGFVITSGPVNADYSGDSVFTNNRILDGSGQMYHSWKPSGKLILWGNDVRDPDNDTDYGFQFYASNSAEICHNYLWGQFDQAVSFKEGDVNPTIGYNTLEGGEYAGFFIGQNGNSNGLGLVKCNPCSVHHNWIGKSGNGFRSVGPIRPWHFTGTINVHDNVVVGAQEGIEVNCGPGPIADRDGCGDGLIRLTNNAFAGRVDGSTPMLGCFLESYGSASTGTNGPLTVTADGMRCWDTQLKYAWNLPLTLTHTTTGSNPQISPLGPAPKFDPDLHLLGGTPPSGDTTPPSAVPNLKRNDVKTESDPGRIWFTWDPATDDVGVDHYREYRDGLLVDAAVSPSLANPGPGDYVGDGTLAPCSDHPVGIEAVDAAGNVGTRTTVTMKTNGCDTVPPETTLTVFPADATGFSWAFGSDDAGAHFECSWQGGAYQPCEPGYAFKVRAVDAAGNVDATPVVVTWGPATR